MVFRSPRLVRIEPFDDYLAHLGKRARREYRYAEHAYPLLSCAEVPLERAQIQRWMRLWEAQIVEGRHPTWTVSVDQFISEGWRWLVSDIGAQPLLVCGSYCYAGPPIYDKEQDPYAAKFHWFAAIRWCAELGLEWLDLQGPGRTNWRALLEQPDRSYKWLFVQRDIREHPERAEPWLSQCCPCGWRQLVVRESPCVQCSCR